MNNIGNDGMDINSKNYYKSEKEKLESYNKQLLLHIKNVEEENKNLRDALKDLRELEREKDFKLEESIKLIISQKAKNDNYAKELENYEKKINLCQQEIKDLRKNTKEDVKQKEFLENVDKVNSSLKSERDKMKKELSDLKAKFDEIKATNQDLNEESKLLKKEIEELKEKNTKHENDKIEMNERESKSKSVVNKLNNDLIKKDEEVKTLIKMAQELNNESKINIDEVTKQSKDIVNMFYNNFTNKNSQNSTMSFDKLLDVYKDCQILSKPEIQKSIKENKISFVLEQAILKDFVLPEIFVNERSQSTCAVSIPLEIFYNLTLKTDLLKVEMMAGYLREMNIVEFIEEKFNKKIVNILDKNVFVNNKNTNSFKETKKGFLSDQVIMNNTAYLGGQNKGSFNLTNNNNNNQFNTAQGFKFKSLNENMNMTNFSNVNPNQTQYSNYQSQNQFVGYLDFFQNLANAFTEAQEKIEVLENNIMLLNHENSLLKSTNREYQEKNVFYEESIMSLKEHLKSTQNIFETKLSNTMKLVQQMSLSSKEKELKIKEHLEKIYNDKISALNKEIRDLNDQIILKTTLVSITQKESEKYKILAEKNSLSNKGNDKNKRVNKNNSDFYIHLEQQEKDASILEVELEKLKSEMKINIEKLNLCNVKLQDSESEIERLTKYSNLLKHELDKNMAEKSNLLLELENAKLNLNIAEEKIILTNQPKIINKDRLNQTGISSANVLDNKSNNNNSNLNFNNQNKELESDTKRNLKDIKDDDKSVKVLDFKEIKEENSRDKSSHHSKKLNEVNDKQAFKSTKTVLKKTDIINNTFNANTKKPTMNYYSKEDSSINSSSPMNQNMYFNNNSNMLNESFNKDSYIKKKQENSELKNQIDRLKDQLREIIHEKNQLEEHVNSNVRHSFINLSNNREVLIEITPYYSNVNNNFTKPLNPFISKKLDNRSNLILGSLLEKTSNLKQNCKFSTFNELRKYYLEYNMDLDKIAQKIEEVSMKFSKIEKTILEDDENKKIKIGYVKEAFNQTDKLLYLLNTYIGKYNKDFYFYSSNLQKALDFLYNNVYYENSELSLLLNQGYSELGQNLLNEAIGNKPKQEIISNVTSYESK